MKDYLRCTTTFQLPELCAQNSLNVHIQVFEECGIQIPPPKKKIVREVRTLGLSWSRVPPYPHENLVRTLTSETPRVSPPYPENLVRILDFDFRVGKNTLPQVCVCGKLITVSHLIRYLHAEFIIYSIYINHSITWNNVVHSIIIN